MSALKDMDKKALLKLARSAISDKLADGSKKEVSKDIPESLKEKRGCFVTLYKNGMLRGCIGTIEPVKSLIECVTKNAINAAFKDPRFPPLKKEELPAVNIEISVLTVPKELDFKDVDDLKMKLKPNIHGVILSRGWQHATFLPQVWEQLPDKDNFLEQLCYKGGMGKESLHDQETTVMVYEAEHFSE